METGISCVTLSRAVHVDLHPTNSSWPMPTRRKGSHATNSSWIAGKNNATAKEIWPPYSPDLNLLVFFVWCTHKLVSNETAHSTRTMLKAAIVESFGGLNGEIFRKSCGGFAAARKLWLSLAAILFILTYSYIFNEDHVQFSLKYIHKQKKLWHFFFKKSRWNSYDGPPFIIVLPGCIVARRESPVFTISFNSSAFIDSTLIVHSVCWSSCNYNK